MLITTTTPLKSNRRLMDGIWGSPQLQFMGVGRQRLLGVCISLSQMWPPHGTSTQGSRALSCSSHGQQFWETPHCPSPHLTQAWNTPGSPSPVQELIHKSPSTIFPNYLKTQQHMQKHKYLLLIGHRALKPEHPWSIPLYTQYFLYLHYFCYNKRMRHWKISI